MDQVKAALTGGSRSTTSGCSRSIVARRRTLGVWYTGSASVASQYDERSRSRSAIKSQSVSGVTGHQNAAFKPNDDINARATQKRARKQAENASVLQEWRKLYDSCRRTRSAGLAEGIGRTTLSGSGAERQISATRISAARFRELYQNYIKRGVPFARRRSVDARLMDADSTGGYAGGGGRGGGEYGRR